MVLRDVRTNKDSDSSTTTQPFSSGAFDRGHRMNSPTQRILILADCPTWFTFYLLFLSSPSYSFSGYLYNFLVRTVCFQRFESQVYNNIMDTASFSLQSTWVCGRSLLSQRLNPCGLFLISSAVRNVGARRLKSYCKRNKQQSLVASTVEKQATEIFPILLLMFMGKVVKKPGKIEHHLWKKRDSTGSGTKALDLIRIVSEQPNVKEAVYGALDKWVAWELEFPLIAAAKALRILKKQNQWIRVIQVSWMLSKGQGATMATYDTLLLSFDMESRIDEAASLWNMILLTHRHSVSKQLFSRMIALYDRNSITEKIVEVFGDMEELGVNPEEDTEKDCVCIRRTRSGLYEGIGY